MSKITIAMMMLMDASKKGKANHHHPPSLSLELDDSLHTLTSILRKFTLYYTLTLMTRCVMSEALKKKVFFITFRWLDSRVHTSEQRVSVLATSSKVDTESGTRVSSTGRKMGGGLCSWSHTHEYTTGIHT